ncbi:MAG: peptidoglycan-binding domain-containing protein [Patescibacteria group bacterium]
MKFRAMLLSILCATPLFSFAVSLSKDLNNTIQQNRESFSRNLREGMLGDDVREIQKILNRDAQTRLAEAGYGSLGNETDYFGPLMKAAIVRFQMKYANEVLAPVGMTQGSGYVGFYTRSKLNTFFSQAIGLENTRPTASFPVIAPNNRVVPVLTLNSSTTTVPKNPNLENLDKFLSIIDANAVKQGLSPAAIEIIHKEITKSMATTTDMRAAFLKTIQGKSPTATQENSYAGKILAKIEKAFDKIFRPESAQAATGLPFGGALLGAGLVCNDATFWLIAVEPLPPSYPANLTYVPGTQGFASHNIPVTSWLLGEYVPGLGTCLLGVCPGPGCVPYQSNGLISTFVGSSAL